MWGFPRPSKLYLATYRKPYKKSERHTFILHQIHPQLNAGVGLGFFPRFRASGLWHQERRIESTHRLRELNSSLTPGKEWTTISTLQTALGNCTSQAKTSPPASSRAGFCVPGAPTAVVQQD